MADSNVYEARALALLELVTLLQDKINETTDSYPDKLQAILVSSEVLNKCLYSFSISKEMYEDIDKLLNNDLMQLRDEANINRLFGRVKQLVQQFTLLVLQWVRVHCE